LKDWNAEHYITPNYRISSAVPVSIRPKAAEKGAALLFTENDAYPAALILRE